jgi:hypothetical protein
VWLGTYRTDEEDARAYATAAWRFSRGRDALNFPKIGSHAEAEFLAPPLLIATACETMHVHRDNV